jgi:dimethylargininase
VRHIAPRHDLPDSVFVEDTAVVLDALAIITRPGASCRRPETDAVSEALASHRKVVRMEAPATIDGGDVLVLGTQIFVGRTARTNQAGVDQLRTLAEPFGYAVSGIDVRGCLHLKSAVTRLDENSVILNPDWVDRARFGEWRIVTVDPSEPHAANVLWLGQHVILPQEFPRTTARIAAASPAHLLPVPAGELARAEGGVTCGSLIVR